MDLLRTMISVVIDVGGSGIDYYDLKTGDKKSITYAKQLLEMNSINDIDSEFICNCIDGFLHLVPKNKLPEVIIGLPGPITSSKTTLVNCPPLNTSINIEKYRSLGIRVLNDVTSQVPLVENRKLVGNKPSVLVTIGTSLGYCSFDPVFDLEERLLSTTSRELAHLRLSQFSSYPLNQLQRLIHSESNECIYKLFSAGGFARCLGASVETRRNGMLYVTSAAMVDVLNEVGNTKRIELWVQSLSMLLRMFFEHNEKTFTPLQLYMRGGFLKAVSQSCYKQIFEQYFILL